MQKKHVKAFAIIGSLVAVAGVFTLYKYWKSSRLKKALSDKPDSAAASVASKPVKAETPSVFPIGTGSAKNDLVRQLQGYLGVTADGVWGPKTQAAFTLQTGKTKILSQAEFDQVIASLQAKTAQTAGKLRADDLTTRWLTDKNLQLMAVKKTVGLGVSKDAYGALNLTGKNIELGANIPYSRADYTPMGTTTNGYLLFSINTGTMKGMYKISANDMTLK